MSPRIAQLLRELIGTGRMPSERGLRSWWERARVSLGLQDDVDFVFHVCRHTCATRMVDAGINVLVIQNWLGHKVIATTLRYAHVRSENLDEALLRVGEYQVRGIGKAQFSAVSDVPQVYPQGGGNTPFARAA